ncbi:MAG TPA: ABC transporter permease [Micromonosporaceae bacterium]
MTGRSLARIGLAVPALLVIGGALIGPWLVGGDPGEIVALPYTSPEPGLPLGADHSGRDVLDRLLAGGRPLVLVPVTAVVLTAVLGTATGMAAGYFGGVWDAVVSRWDGILLTVPPILVLLVLLHGWGYSSFTLILVVLVVGVPFVSRMVRAATRQVMRDGYVEQAIAQGERPMAVLVREILPNVLRPIVADAGTRLAIAVTLTASAGFLGFGPDEPNWGAMISQNVEGIGLTPWGVIAPASCLATLAVSANLALDRFAARIGR